MATSTVTTLGTPWVQVAAAGYLAIQNIGNEPIILNWSATEPTGADGFIAYPVDGYDNATFGDGPVWARAVKSVGKVIVNV